MSLSKNCHVLLRSLLVFGLFFAAISTLSAATSADLLNKKISLSAEDASISDVLTTMAKLSDCNIVLALDVQSDPGAMAKDEKRITLDIKDLPIEQALSLVVKATGLSYRLVGDSTFLVGEKGKIEKEIGERSYVIQLNYTDVVKISKALSVMPGKISAIEGQNALLLMANPQTYADVMQRISELDIPQKQIEIRARLIEVNVTESEKSGIDWSRLNKLTTIIAEDPTNADGVGLPYNYTDETGALPHGTTSNFQELPEDQYWQKMDSFDDVGHFSRQLTAFDITIDWLLENNAAKLLTDTRITAKNGEDADILIGEDVPYVVQDRDYQVQVEHAEVGIKLKVKPTVNSDGMITATISPEVSSVIELVGGYVPRTKVRRVTSTVTVADGSKIIVGGLLNSTVSTKVNKLPFLGNLPWVGRFFRHTVEEVSNTDLLIEITPRIVTDADINVTYKVDPRLERRLITDDEIEELTPDTNKSRFNYNFFKNK